MAIFPYIQSTSFGYAIVISYCLYFPDLGFIQPEKEELLHGLWGFHPVNSPDNSQRL
jgi:hypothetical protein